MSITIRCDKCGYELEVHGVVTNSHKTHGFSELSCPLPGGIRDLCKPCMKEVTRASIKAKQEEHETHRSRMLKLLGI